MSVTITSLYDDRASAEAAVTQLQSRVPNGSFRVIAGTGEADDKGFWATLKEAFLPYEDRSLYGEGISRGSYLLHAEVEEPEADEVCDLLEQSGPIDMEERERSWRSEGWQPGRDSDDTLSSSPDSGSLQQQPAGSRRQTERGGARVRSYVHEPAERPAESDGNGSSEAETEKDFAATSTDRRDDKF